MAKTVAHRNLGGPGTPNDIKQLRESRFEMLEELGYPVLHKHRWNERDLQEGLVEQCPLHDDLYDQDPTWDPVCFGTGYVGGYADPAIVYVTINDAPQDTLNVLPTGVVMFDHHPQVTAPWLPEMGDGDLLILADFDPMTWEVLNTHERYTLNVVTPYTIRGPQIRSKSTVKERFRIQQDASADKMPWGHRAYDVPLIFDPSVIPDYPVDPDPDQPDPDQPDPGQPDQKASLRVPVRIVGAESIWKPSSHKAYVRLDATDVVGTLTRSVRITGIADDEVIIHF
jgi:hypothetical protein